jgi:hypothetical protein
LTAFFIIRPDSALVSAPGDVGDRRNEKFVEAVIACACHKHLADGIGYEIERLWNLGLWRGCGRRGAVTLPSGVWLGGHAASLCLTLFRAGLFCWHLCLPPLSISSSAIANRI